MVVRRLAASVGLLLALVLMLVASGTAVAAPAPRVAQFEQRLTLPQAPRLSAATARWRTTAPLRAPHTFDLLGLRWRGGNAHVQLRVELRRGRWSRWVAAASEGAPARATGATQASGPIWSGAARRYQVRSDRPLRGLRVRFVAVEGNRTPTARAAGADGRPAIVPRSAWDPGDACHPRTAPSYGRVDFAIVHHTESLSLYGPAQSADMVLAICLFHRDGNRWNDIGYDLLVDRYGTVFEGRAGGVDQPVIGAQAGGWNSVSTGVAMIGSYSLEAPPAAAQQALVRVLAWKLGLAGVPATGTIAERSTGRDPADNAHPRGAHVVYQRISGHRDADLTDCPGGALYALLPRLRGTVAGLMEPPADLLTISPTGAPWPQGAGIPLTGRLVRAGERPAGAAVALRQQVDGAWRTVAVTHTGADGVWSAAPRLSVDGPVQAVDASGGIVSPAVAVAVGVGVRTQVAPSHPRTGHSIAVAGTTTPPKGRVRVLVERRTRSGRFVRVRSLAVATDAGRFTTRLAFAVAGLYRVTATASADAANAAGSSAPRLVRVLRRR